MFNEWKTHALMQLKKVQYCEKPYQTFRGNVDYGINNFNMLSSGSTFSSLEIRRSAGNYLHFLSILIQYDCWVAQEENPFSIILVMTVFQTFFFSFWKYNNRVANTNHEDLPHNTFLHVFVSFVAKEKEEKKALLIFFYN